MLRRALACSRRAVHAGHEITSNGYGVMMADHDRFEAAWVTAASQLDLECCALELGAAFGRATLDALVQGCPHVVCNDLDASHLAEVERRFRSSNAVGSLTTLCGRVPSTLEGWEPPSPLRAVLAANILHFLHPKEAQLTLSRLHDICAEGAELFVSLDAPWTQSFRPLWPLYYARNIAGDQHPGYTRLVGPLRGMLPDRLRGISVYNPMEPPHLLRMLEASGWSVVESTSFPGNAVDNPAGVSIGNLVEMTGAHAVKRGS